MTPLRRSGLVGWTICIALAAGIASAGAQVEVEFGADDLIKQAREFLATGRNVEAIDALKKALGKRPFDAAARLLASRAYLRIGNGAAAEREATRAANSRGVPSLVIPALGRALLLQGKYDDLLLRIRPVRLPAKAAAEALFLRGQAHFARIEYSFARAEFERALARDPGQGRRRGVVPARPGPFRAHRVQFRPSRVRARAGPGPGPPRGETRARPPRAPKAGWMRPRNWPIRRWPPTKTIPMRGTSRPSHCGAPMRSPRH